MYMESVGPPAFERSERNTGMCANIGPFQGCYYLCTMSQSRENRQNRDGHEITG